MPTLHPWLRITTVPEGSQIKQEQGSLDRLATPPFVYLTHRHATSLFMENLVHFPEVQTHFKS